MTNNGEMKSHFMEVPFSQVADLMKDNGRQFNPASVLMM